jgi:hypothetical protein
MNVMRVVARSRAGIWAVLLLAGCRGGIVSHKDAAAGNWRPILLSSGAAIRLPSPPGARSELRKAETEELHVFKARRTPQIEKAVRFWDGDAVVRWNEITRDLVAKHRTDHPTASRVYALVSVAQYDALIAAWNNKYFHLSPAPKPEFHGWTAASAGTVPGYPCEHAVVAGASAKVLEYLYPDEAEFLGSKLREHEESRLWAGASFRSDVVAGDSLGREVAGIVIEYARKDGSDARWQGALPGGKGLWRNASGQVPLAPHWGSVKPWLMASDSQFRAKEPPAFESPEFRSALAEVKHYSESLTPEQARIAALWADGPGSYAPSGRWNKIAADLAQKSGLGEVRSARVFALLNIGMMDAGIACWDTKYHYWLIRPPQADSSINTPVGLPNFPSYPSAHATFSGAGAEVLGYLFPSDKEALLAKAKEASMSRIYGGIHYRFDGDAGLEQGRAVADLAISRGQSDGSP